VLEDNMQYCGTCGNAKIAQCGAACSAVRCTTLNSKTLQGRDMSGYITVTVGKLNITQIIIVLSRPIQKGKCNIPRGQ
jgi:hypothetical protein